MMYPPGYWTLLLIYTAVFAVLFIGGYLLVSQLV
jgi:hypothetical protein